MFFCYGRAETDYLASRDPVLGAAIDRIGHIDREVFPDLFEALTTRSPDSRFRARRSQPCGRVCARQSAQSHRKTCSRQGRSACAPAAFPAARCITCCPPRRQ